MMADGPVQIADIDVVGPFSGLPVQEPHGTPPYVGAQVLVRLGTEPLGTLDLPIPVTGHELAGSVWEMYGAAIRSRLAAAGVAPPAVLDERGLGLTQAQRDALPWVVHRERVLASAPNISVIICTRDPDEGLAITMSAAAALEYPHFEIVLVDNASSNHVARTLVESREWDVPVRLVIEPRPGLSRARNAGARVAKGDLLAFLDDDETPDRHWLSEYARAFHAVPDAGAASGLILPRSLDNSAQRFFEAIGGHSKGRGFEPKVFDQASHATQHPLYPMPPFGAGGNMCFRREVLGSIGYFDEALGAGTPARGGEDTAAFADTMLAGFTTVWQPSALVRHDHYDTFEGAGVQLRGYGIGLTAFYTRMVVGDPRRIGPLSRLVARGVKDLRRPGATLIGTQKHKAPPGLRRAQWTGLALGPTAYLSSRSKLRQTPVSSG
jgi:glycosyltransferase involved in cell wall biosynthesis